MLRGLLRRLREPLRVSLRSSFVVALLVAAFGMPRVAHASGFGPLAAGCAAPPLALIAFVGWALFPAPRRAWVGLDAVACLAWLGALVAMPTWWPAWVAGLALSATLLVHRARASGRASDP